ncbi:hypothetical protein ACH5AO_07170 [Streptomyces sp. NPDC018964]|uniref:hypothetical protein n=1 Tax=unclassified Streptomyces TaxID=2593676 RepID=UPI0037A1B1B2
MADAVRRLEDHRLSAEPEESARIGRARMGRRLARWLPTDPPTDAPTVAVQRHVAETGWADLALGHIEAGRPHPTPPRGTAERAVRPRSGMRTRPGVPQTLIPRHTERSVVRR